MKWFKKSGEFKGSYNPHRKFYNVTFNPDTTKAYSYNWWIFVKKINGLLVFNDYSYSNTTNRHQSKVKTLLHNLGYHIDLYIEAPDGLQSLSSAIEHYNQEIKALEQAIDKPRSNNEVNVKRMYEIEVLQRKIEEVQGLISA